MEINGLESDLIRIGTFSSVATHWLPNIIKEFQKDYPNIDYELLLGDYAEIEEWIKKEARLQLKKICNQQILAKYLKYLHVYDII